MQPLSWLAGLTGADKFANNPANGFAATLGDFAQAAGHSMAQHYRGKGGTYGGPELVPGVNASPDMVQMLPTAPTAGPAIQGQALPAVNNSAPAAEPAPISPAARSATTSGLNGASPWGVSGMAGQVPLSLLLQLGLR